MTPPSTPTKFTPASSIEVAQEAARSVGLNGDSAELIRMGTNAVLRLPGAVIARVARDESAADVAHHELQVAVALKQAGVPCVRPCAVRQPVIVSGHPVTFWVEVPGPLVQPTLADLGTLLRQLHGVQLKLDVPQLDPWGNTPERIEQVPITDAQRRVLRDALNQAHDEWPGVHLALDPGVVHGDAYLGNVLHGADDSVVLADFDSVCTGPREWDLVPTGLYAKALGWITRDEYRAFVAAYGGFDVTQTPAFDLLARIREIRMTAWLAMYADESEKVAAEVAHRVACIADPSLPRHWSVR